MKLQRQMRKDSQSEKLSLFLWIHLFYIQLLISLLSSSFSHFFSPFHKGFFTLYSSFWIILTLHLSIIWDFTWVSVPSDTSPGFMWVVVTKVSLFRYLLHINADRKVVTMNLMRWWQLFLRYFCALPPFFHIHKTRLHLLSFLKGSSSCWDTNLRYASHIREGFPSRTFLQVSLTYEALRWAFTNNLLGHFSVLRQVHGPIYYFRPLPLQLYFIMNILKRAITYLHIT